jgi:hypothetical protein
MHFWKSTLPEMGSSCTWNIGICLMTAPKMSSFVLMDVVIPSSDSL